MPSSPNPPTLTELKSRAQRLDATVRVGKAGVDPAFYVELNRCLDARHLVKIKFMAFKDERKSLAPAIATATESKVVLFVGNTLTLYRVPKTPLADN